MPEPTRLEAQIHQLWDQLAEFDAMHHDAALDHLLAGLCRLTQGQNAIWFAAIRLNEAGPRDPFMGWRPKGRHLLKPLREEKQFYRLVEKRVREEAVDLSTMRNVALAGRLRANRLTDLVPDDWFEGDYYQRMYRRFGLHDAIWAGCPVNEDTEVYIGVYRHIGQPSFTEEERDTVEAILRGLKWFHRGQLLSRGIIVANTPLSPTERRVLTGLLSGAYEKEIATNLDHTTNTTHDYVKSIYRKFGVSNRAGLMALWLGPADGSTEGI